MKKFLTLVVLAVITTCGISAQTKTTGLNFLHNMTYEQAQDYTTKNNKILMVDVYTSWCGPCKNLTDNVFPNKAVEPLNAQIVGYKVNAEEGEGLELAPKWKISGYPTLIFFAKGKEIGRIVGAPSTAEDFLEVVTGQLKEFQK